MKMKTLFIATVCTLFATVVMAQTLDEVLASNRKAEGGDLRAKFNTVILKGKMEMLAQDMEMPMTVTYKRPNMHRTDMEMMGKTVTRATDGKEYWSAMPAMMGKGKPTIKTMEPDEMKEFQHHSSIDGLLRDYKSFGMTATLIGKTTRDSIDVYKIVFTDKDDNQQSYYLDAKTYLLYASEQTVKGKGGNDVTLQMTYSDYRSVGGSMFPFKAMQKAGPMEIAITYESITPNVDVDDSIFKKASVEQAPDESK